MDKHRIELVERALQAQQDIMLALQATAGPTWLQLDLTMTQIKALFLLALASRMTIGQLAGSLGVGKPAASILVDHLVTVGLVERAEDTIDRRRTFASLSPRGRETVMQVRQGGRERLVEAMGRMSDDDLAALARGLRALATEAAGQQVAARN